MLAECSYAVAANDLEAPEATLKEIENIGARCMPLPGFAEPPGP